MKFWLVVALGAVLAGCASSDTVAIPDLVGLPLNEAREMLDGFELEEVDASGQGRAVWSAANWTVTDQDPPAGSSVETGSTVVLGLVNQRDQVETADSPVSEDQGRESSGDDSDSPGQIAGRSACASQVGSPRGEDGERPETIPAGQDLIGGSLSIEDDVLTVTWEATQDIPAQTDEAGGLFWGANLWVDEETGYGIKVFLDEETDAWSSQVIDWAILEHLDIPGGVDRQGRDLVVHVPLELLPSIESSFRWYLTTEWGHTYFYTDACPWSDGPTIPIGEQPIFPDPQT